MKEEVNLRIEYDWLLNKKFILLLCVFTFWVPCCGVRTDFRI